MGVRQVTRPRKPQKPLNVVYLADGSFKSKQVDKADATDENSQEEWENTSKTVDEIDEKFKLNVEPNTERTLELIKDVNTISIGLGSLDSKISAGACQEQGTDVFNNSEQNIDQTSLESAETKAQGLDIGGEFEDHHSAADNLGLGITESVNSLLRSYTKVDRARSSRKRNNLIENTEISSVELKNIASISQDIEGAIVRRYNLKDRTRNSRVQGENMKRVTRRKTPEMRVQTCGRGRPRKKSFGKRGGNSGDKQTQDGSENGEGRASRGSRQQRGGGQGNGGNGGRRRRDDDDRDDDNDDVEDDFDENNEEEDEEEDEQTGTESVVDDTEMTPEQEAEMAQELLCLIPPKNLNCDPPEKPAKPGTAVNLHGVVLHETSGGLVVLNVRWRNKIYSGALIDVRKSRWASERIKPDPFPEGANPKPADLIRLNGKRKGKKSKSPELNEKETKETAEPKPDQTFKEPVGIPVVFKRPTESSNGEGADCGANKRPKLSPPLIECPEPNCGKKYSHKNGLKYHQAHAHQNKTEAEDAKPPVTASGQRVTAAENEASSTSKETQAKIPIDQKPSISQLHEVKIKQADVSAESTTTTKALVQSSSHVQVSFASTVTTSTSTENPPVSIVPAIKIKTEEENAVDSITDCNFEEAQKAKESSQQVPKIMLEPSSGEAATELSANNEGGRVDMARPESLFSIGNQAGLAPFNSRINFAQFSPTLASLNPQTLNNSLSNALQTAGSKTGDKFETDAEGKPKEGSTEEKTETEEDARAKLRLEMIMSPSGDPLQAEQALRRLIFSKDIKSEDMVPSSPDEPASSSELLPGSLGSHLFLKEGKLSASASQTFPPRGLGYDQPGFPATLFSESLYNQLRQEQAAKLYPGADSAAGDLAEPSDIQRAISQVDVRRHFSPMLLNYLNTGARARDISSEGETISDEVSTTNKSDEGAKSTRKHDNKEGSSPSSTSILPHSSGQRTEQGLMRRDRTLGNLQQKPEFLQPNISAGRPIVKPATKPESITGGLKMSGGGQPRFGPQGQFVTEKQAEDGSQGEGPTAGDHSGAPKNLSPTSYVDKQMIEAKTWVPQEVYRQPQQKPVSTQERPQFSPGKEKQAIHMRRGQEMGRKSGSPYDHGSAAADYMKKLEQGSSPNQSGKKIKQPTSASVPYPSPVMSAPSSESERSKQQEIQTENMQEGPEISHFTLTGDRLIPSPDRGRPRKIRVEKTQQIPVGSAKDIEGSRGALEHPSRKQTTTCNYTRTSVIHSMSAPQDDMRTGMSVKEEYVSPEGKRKSPATQHDRMAFAEKKAKQETRKAEATRIFEAEREKLKTRHVESHYANEVRNMQMRAQEMQAMPKSDIPIRGPVSPGSRFQSMAGSALDKADRHVRERMETKSIPVSPAYGQGSSYPGHPSSEIEKFRSEYLQHDLHRLPTPFGGSLPPSVEGYPGLSTPYSGSSYYGQRSGMSQVDSLAAHQRFEPPPSHMEHEKAFAKYFAEKSDMGLKLGQEPSKHPHAERMRPSSRDGHSHRPPFYPHASPLGFQSREPSNPSRSAKGSPFNNFRLGEMFAASRAQQMESGDIVPKDSKTPIGDGRRDGRREFGTPYGAAFFQPSFQYGSVGSSKGYPQRMSGQRSPYKHLSELEKSRYPPSHSSSQAHGGPGGMLSANLVVTKADSLGYGSVHYDPRNPDGKK